ncbi:NAD-dependent epimerase/dehydratase family protein [Planctomycetota bacterium]
MNVLVTGAAGFLGSAIVRQAVRSNLSVTAIDLVENVQLSGAKYFCANILEPRSLAQPLKDVECLCHVAGLAHIFGKSEIANAPYHNVNVEGSKNVALVAAQAGVQRIIYISSVSVYGREACDKDVESECQPEGPYAKSKLQAEQGLIEICQKGGMDLTVLRLATLYGEEDPGNVGRLVRLIECGRFIWIGRGKNLKSLLHCDDAARACVAAVTTSTSGIHIYNVSAPPYKMCDIVEAIARALGKSAPTMYVPIPVALVLTKLAKKISFNNERLGTLYDTMQKWISDDYYNTDTFNKTFNYRTTIGLNEGIQRQVARYVGRVDGL